ncbi:putative CASP-like protein 5A2 [Sesbania bispinosa]|nr:putative CASP-like protein 5A2 [Sesbania bispinosa]
MVRPSVHPIEAPPLALTEHNAMPRHSLKDVQGMGGFSSCASFNSPSSSFPSPSHSRY